MKRGTRARGETAGPVETAGEEARGERSPRRRGTKPVDNPTYCGRWKATGAGALPNFATNSECVDFTAIPTGDVPCSGNKNAGAKLAELYVAQTHLITPTSENFTTNQGGVALEPGSIRPKFRLLTNRPALLKVGLTGSGPSPEVRVVGKLAGKELGSFCLKGPASLPAAMATKPTLTDSFAVSLPSEWIKPGLELELSAGGTVLKQIPTTDLRITGGTRHTVVEMYIRTFGETSDRYAPRATSRMASHVPAQSLIWSHFPATVTYNPVVVEPSGDKPARIVTAPDGVDIVANARNLTDAIQHANGHQAEAKWYGSLNPSKYGGGLGGGDVAAGGAGVPFIRHELGHTYGLPHLEPAYDEKKYPFLYDTQGHGGGVGPSGRSTKPMDPSSLRGARRIRRSTATTPWPAATNRTRFMAVTPSSGCSST